MKITKEQLKQIIEEEIKSLSERVSPEHMEALDKVKAIKALIDDSMRGGKIPHFMGLGLMSQIQDILERAPDGSEELNEMNIPDLDDKKKGL